MVAVNEQMNLRLSFSFVRSSVTFNCVCAGKGSEHLWGLTHILVQQFLYYLAGIQ